MKSYTTASPFVAIFMADVQKGFYRNPLPSVQEHEVWSHEMTKVLQVCGRGEVKSQAIAPTLGH